MKVVNSYEKNTQKELFLPGDPLRSGYPVKIKNFLFIFPDVSAR
jgi:hypothetical protein